MNLPLSQSGPGRCLARGVLLDYPAGTITPCTMTSLARLLAAVERYGVHRPVGQSCDLLTHSVLVGNVAARLGRIAEVSASMRHALNLYGRLHDLGETLGGDVVAQMPVEVMAAFRAYQSTVRETLCRKLGLPTPSGFMQALIKIADLAVVSGEMARMGGIGGGGATVETCLLESEATHGTVSKLAARLSAVPGLESLTPLNVALEAAGLASAPALSESAFCRVPTLVLDVDADDRVIQAFPTVVGALESAQGVRLVATRDLNQGHPAASFTLAQARAGFPREIA